MLTYVKTLALFLLPLACVTTATIRTDLTDDPVADAGGRDIVPGGADAGVVAVDPPDAGGTPAVDSGTVVGEGEGEGEPVPVPSRTGLGFRVDGLVIRDAEGQPFRIQGIATTLWWGHQDRNRLAVPELAKAGANAVRLVFGPGMGEDTAAEQRAVVQQAVASKLVPIVTDMGATCKTDLVSFEAVVTRWLEPERVAYLKEFEKFVILNIANEALGFDGPQWRDAYVDAILRLRAAGVHALIMVDAGGACGQNPRTIRDYGAAVLLGDPDRNVVFSFHAYGYHRTAGASDVGRWNDFGTQSPWRTADEIAAIRARGLAVVVGEIGWNGSPQVAYDTRSMLLDLNLSGTGYIAWSWSQNSDSALDLLTYASPTNYLFRVEDLSPAGVLFVQDSTVGLLATARRATVF
jgi:mannan endo-1,4-beta-mannosidase